MVTLSSYFILLFHVEIKFVQISPFRKAHLIVVFGQRINLKALHLLNMLSRQNKVSKKHVVPCKRKNIPSSLAYLLILRQNLDSNASANIFVLYMIY